MGSRPMGPGTVLGGRYRLDDLLTDHDGARFWRATDTVLARSVAVHALASTDDRAPGVLEAARTSVTVTDPHFLRVLDCDDDGELTWVINEWGSGQSLDLMLQRGTLPPVRAAWLAREVAEAIAAAHAQDVQHGRLNPEAVLVTEAGAVKIIGFVTNRAFEGSLQDSTPYGGLDPREADVIDLAGILYAALTGKWPGASPSAVPPAPRVNGRPLRPRQVKAGIPRTLDTICDRVLNKEASRHSLPIETAHEIAAALTDFVGDPTLSAPLDVPSMHAEPTRAIPRAALEDLQAASLHSSDPDATIASPPPWAGRRDNGTRAAGTDDPEQTRAVPVTEVPDAHAHASREPVNPPPPLEEPAERPLFADHERRVPRNAPKLPPYPPGGGGRSTSGGATSTGTGAGGAAAYWPFQDEDDDTGGFSGKEGRGWLKLAAIVGLVIAVLAGMFLAFNYGRGSDEPPAAENGRQKGSVTVGAPVQIVGGQDFDPEGDPPTENPESVPQAFDGNPDTGWRTLTYRGNPKLGGLKSGVGLVLDLGADKTVGSVSVSLRGQPTQIALWATPNGVSDPPDVLDDFKQVSDPVSAGERHVFRPEQKVQTRFLLLWMTELPPADGGFRAEITEVQVHS